MTSWSRRNRPNGKLYASIGLLLGIAGVALYNRRLWQRDKKALSKKQPALPASRLADLPVLPTVSVLVAAWNEEHNIREHVASFLALRYPHKELILCAGGEDRTYELAARHTAPGVTVLLQQPGEGKQHALARCLQQSEGTIVFLTDADCLLDDASFESTLAPLILEGEQAATGRFAPQHRQRNRPFVMQQWYVDTYWRERSGPYLEGLIGRNAAVLRALLEKTDAFSAPVRTGTDYYLARRLLQEGVKIRYAHDSMVETEFADSVPAYLRQQSRWLRNIILHGSAFGAAGQVRQALAQCLIGLAVMLWPLSFPVTGPLGVALWLLVVAHGTLARCRYVRFGELALGQPHRTETYRKSPLYFLIDQVMLSYAIVEWLAPQSRWRW